MPPDAEDCERPERPAAPAPAPVHAGRRVVPARPAPPERAWRETERPGRANGRAAAAESRRLLAPAPRLGADLARAVWGARGKPAKHAPPGDTDCAKVKTRYRRRREKLIAALRPPYFILGMIVVMVAVQAGAARDAAARLEWAPGEWWREPWRLLTYSCVHASAPHLALNALVALAVGWMVEREQGAWRTAAVWGGGVACGALGAGALQPRVRVVGASAAVYALLTAHLPNVCLRFGHIPLWWFRPLSVVVLAASEGCWALLHAPAALEHAAHAGHAAHTQGTRVAWAAHVFGAAAGVPLAFLVFTGEHRSRRAVVYARALSALVLAAGGALAAAHYACWHQPDARPAVRELPAYHAP